MFRVLLGIAALNVAATFAAACDGYCHGYFEEFPPVHGYYELPPGPGWAYAPGYYAEPVPHPGYPPARYPEPTYSRAAVDFRQQPGIRTDSFGSPTQSFAQPREDRRFTNVDQSQFDQSRFDQTQFGGGASQGGRFQGNDFDQSRTGGFGQSPGQNFPSGAGGGFGSPGGSFGGGVGGGSFNPSPGGNPGGSGVGAGGGGPDIASPGRVSPGRYYLGTPK